MPAIISKSTCAIEYPLSNGKSVLLKGYGFVDEIDNNLWKQALKEYPCLHELVDNGDIIVSNVANNKKHSDEALHDAMNDVKNKQIKDIADNADTNNVEIIEGKKNKWKIF